MAKRKRYSCSNCKKNVFVVRWCIDSSEEHVLCRTCDDAYIAWCNRSPNNVYVDDFLKTYAAKKCKSH